MADSTTSGSFRKGLLRGLGADILGAPVDLGLQVANLGIAGGGYLGHKMGLLEKPPELLNPEEYFGSSDWIAKKSDTADDGTGAYTAGRLAPVVAQALPLAGKAVARALSASVQTPKGLLQQGAIRAGGDPTLYAGRRVSGYVMDDLARARPNAILELASPSFGITKNRLMPSNFGNTLLIPREGRLDPATDLSKLWNRDAWTPVYGDERLPKLLQDRKGLAGEDLYETLTQSGELQGIDTGIFPNVSLGTPLVVLKDGNLVEVPADQARIVANVAKLSDKVLHGWMGKKDTLVHPVDPNGHAVFPHTALSLLNHKVELHNPDFIAAHGGLENFKNSTKQSLVQLGLTEPEANFLLKYNQPLDTYAFASPPALEMVRNPGKPTIEQFFKGNLGARFRDGTADKGAKLWGSGDDISSLSLQDASIVRSPTFNSFKEFENSPKGAGLLRKTKGWEYDDLSREYSDLVGQYNALKKRDPAQATSIMKRMNSLASFAPSNYAELKVQRNVPILPETFAGALVPVETPANSPFVQYLQQRNIPFVETPGNSMETNLTAHDWLQAEAKRRMGK